MIAYPTVPVLRINNSTLSTTQLNCLDLFWISNSSDKMSSPQNVLRRERDAATFNPDDMAVILQGSKKRVAMKKKIAALVATDPFLSSHQDA